MSVLPLRLLARRERPRSARSVPDVPPYQTRTCVRCGRQTTFVLQDRAGWYSCVECGRYA